MRMLCNNNKNMNNCKIMNNCKDLTLKCSQKNSNKQTMLSSRSWNMQINTNKEALVNLRRVSYNQKISKLSKDCIICLTVNQAKVSRMISLTDFSPSPQPVIFNLLHQNIKLQRKYRLTSVIKVLRTREALRRLKLELKWLINKQIQKQSYLFFLISN